MKQAIYLHKLILYKLKAVLRIKTKHNYIKTKTKKTLLKSLKFKKLLKSKQNNY